MKCNSLHDRAGIFVPGLSRALRIAFWLAVAAAGGFDTPALAGPYIQQEPYVAPPYVPPPLPESKVHLTDNNDGTLSAPDTGLMWARKDSYSELGRCLNWYEAQAYVSQLKTGGHADWRMPTIKELASIYDNTKETVIGWDGDEEYPLRLSEKFAEGAAYWVWSSERTKTDLTDCCAFSFYFVKGMVHIRRLTMCTNGGVRAVRNIR